MKLFPIPACAGTTKSALLKIILVVALWLIVINLFALAGLNRFNLNSDTSYNWINPNEFHQTQEWNILNLHSHWDSAWYLDVAQHGYIYRRVQQLSNIVFFPLYPLLIKFVAYFILLGNYALAGWILSIIFLLLASFYLSKLVQEFHKKIDWQLPLMFLLIFPTAFFLNGIYTESLFLFLSIASFYYTLKKNYWLAGLFGLLSSLTRITGVLLFIPLIWEYCASRKVREWFSAQILPIFLVPLGTFCFFLFHYLKFGDFKLFLKVEDWWGRSFSINKEHFQLLTHPATVNFMIDSLFVIFAIIITILVFKKLRVSYGLYMVATLLVALSTGTFMSIGRYILVLFPMYILIASFKNHTVKLAYAFTSILLLAMNVILFVNNYWAG